MYMYMYLNPSVEKIPLRQEYVKKALGCLLLLDSCTERRKTKREGRDVVFIAVLVCEGGFQPQQKKRVLILVAKKH
jgi:hypothetical protein